MASARALDTSPFNPLNETGGFVNNPIKNPGDLLGNLVGWGQSGDFRDQGILGAITGANQNAAFNRDIYKQNLQHMQNMLAQGSAQKHQMDLQNMNNAFTQSQNILQGQINNHLQNQQGQINQNLQAQQGEINKDLQQLQGQINQNLQDRNNAFTHYMQSNKTQMAVNDMLKAGINPALGMGAMQGMQSAQGGGSSGNVGSFAGSAKNVGSNFGVNTHGASAVGSGSVNFTTKSGQTFSANVGGSAKKAVSSIKTIMKLIKMFI